MGNSTRSLARLATVLALAWALLGCSAGGHPVKGDNPAASGTKSVPLNLGEGGSRANAKPPKT